MPSQPKRIRKCRSAKPPQTPSWRAPRAARTEPVVTKLIGISGSLRRGSLNTALLRAAAEFVPNGAELTVETIHGIPLYDADVETADGIPERVSALKKAIVAADGLLLATPAASPQHSNRS